MTTNSGPFDLSGRTALVTGASSGLGRHFALTLARAGAKVAVAARRADKLEELSREIEAFGSQSAAVSLDVTASESVAGAVGAAAERLGPIGILVNNAGVASTKGVLEASESDWDQILDTNLKGAWLVAQAAARHMAEHKQGGSIVNIASITGLRVAGQVSAYATSKAALLHLTRSMALELARHKIRVNAIAPGYIATELNQDFFASPAGEALIKRIPQRRLGQPEELDGALLLLASNASSYMTGSTIVVDGGHLQSSL
jgi:NAD(P)-dependent dehydrogenase (short-subunit alcohol dehydrogenase family)